MYMMYMYMTYEKMYMTTVKWSLGIKLEERDCYLLFHTFIMYFIYFFFRFKIKQSSNT